MRVLIVHHLQPMWDQSMRNSGTSFPEVCRNLKYHLEKNHYDKVILTQFEAWKPTDEHYTHGITRYVDQWEEYGYGWCLDAWRPNTEGIDWCQGGTHSNTVMLCDWMRELNGHEVFICGAFDGECIEDLEIALNYLEVEYERIEELII